jgi:hypothetical protein
MEQRKWADLSHDKSAAWMPRAQLAARMLGDVQSVTDIGCGHMGLKQFLPGVRYVPVDCVRRDDETIVVDLNKEPAPTTGTEAVTLLGVIEYLHDAPKLLGDLARSYATILVTYNCYEHRKPADRNKWSNGFTAGDLMHIFSTAGLSVAQTETLGRQTLWLLKSRLAQ